MRFFIGITPVAAAPKHLRIDYVALGDSVASGALAVAGLLPGTITSSDYGYTDLVAQSLDNLGVLRKFNENYAISGMTSSQLLGATSNKDLQLSLKKAEIVTIKVGADDFLGPLYDYFDYCVANQLIPDPESSGFITAMATIIASIPANGSLLQSNLTQIIQYILTVNPDVQIYLMGYYNPLPMIVDNTVTGSINACILGAKNAVDSAGNNTTYVTTLMAINGTDPYFAYAEEYLIQFVLPCIPDIHPTTIGYQRIASVFNSAIADDFGF